MDKEKIFVDGLMFQDPHEKAPEWVKFNLVVNAEKFNDFMKANMQYASTKGWLKIVAKVSKKTDSIYFELDTYEPLQNKAEQVEKEDTETTTYTDEYGNKQTIPF